MLRLQIEWGADEALDPQSLDRLRPISVVSPITIGPAAAAPPPEPLARVAPSQQAAALAAAVATLDGLRNAMAGFDGCALRDTASHLVFAEGNPASSTLVIGEAPAREEDRGGHPFAGTEGELLDQMLASIGLRRGDLMLTPLLPWRPPGGRAPNSAEVAVCLPFLHRLIALLGPRRLVLFGGTAARALLPAIPMRRRPDPDWIECSVPGLREVLPALCLPSLVEMQKTPALRRGAWAGLRRLRRAIDKERTKM